VKIIFDLRNVGLGPNGGSLTLIKSGNALHDLGHEVFFIDNMRNQNTWEELKPLHIIIKNQNQIPDADVIIATGYKSVEPTVSAPSRCGIKAHYIRAWETWQYSPDMIIKKVLMAPTIKIVNGICLQNILKRHGCESSIIYPGYDFEFLYPRSIRQFNPEPVIGGLYRAGVHGQRKRTAWLFETVKALRQNGAKFKFWLMGSEPEPPISFQYDRYLRQPTMVQKNDFYNYIDIWMAPTMSEGLHLPPAEAGLTCCTPVTTNAPLSGTQDYVFHKKTGFVTKNTLKYFIDGVDTMLHNPAPRREYGRALIDRLYEIGDRKKNMGKLVEFLENKI
jgi:glycosyltransferase involved in cell wall biosynthesis